MIIAWIPVVVVKFVGYVVLNSQKHHGEMMVRHQHTIYVIAVGLNLVMRIRPCKV
ncbi:Uncharacterised protein [Salmonella enterica]|nr:Uncharacterised protein [Salmonella enterica]